MTENDNESIDVEALLQSLDNDENVSMINLTTKKIIDMKLDALDELNLEDEYLKELMVQLNDYRIVNEIPDIKYGNYIRWINLINPNDITLRKGGMVVDILLEKTGTHVRVKNNLNRFFQIKMDQCIIFQKLNTQEEIILQVLDYLDNNKKD
tara:strand:- start:645 stop:1100 length:456 start_codon:yes stop_codon:yes gene_type:complete